MKGVLTLFLRAIGIGRAPTTRAGVLYVWSERVVLVALLGMMSLQAFPQLLFPHSISYQDVTMYSPSQLPSESVDVLRKATDLVHASELAVPGRRERVFVSSERWRAWLFKPFSGAFGFSISLTDNVFVTEGDIRLNMSRSSEVDIAPRSLSSVIAHEITHGLIRNRIGIVGAGRLPAWVNEGYCDYVSRESSFSIDEGRRLLISGQRDPSRSFQYFVYREMVRHLIEERGLRFEQVIALADQYESVKAETIAALKAHVQ